jgi:hypothetical protein
MTEWTGRDPVSQDVSIMFDKFADNESIEQEIRVLYRMMRDRTGRRDEPAPVTCVSQTPLTFTGLHWVINGIAPGDEVRRSHDGHRTRAQFTVSLVEYVPGDVVIHQKSSPAKSHQKKQHKDGKGHDTRRYTVRHGDTMQKIAAALLGKRSRWHEIQKLNPSIHDPNHLKVGSHIKVPKS